VTHEARQQAERDLAEIIAREVVATWTDQTLNALEVARRVMAAGYHAGPRIPERIESEIAWLDAEARAHTDAQSASADLGDIEEAVIHKYEARAYRVAAERLRAGNRLRD
jgi:hypothetical protein